MPIRDICSKIFYEELYPLWERAAIPVKPAKKCTDQLVSLNSKFLAMKKIPMIRQKSNNYESKLREFQSSLNCLCDLAPRDVKDVMRRSRNSNWQEDGMGPSDDLKFLSLMKSYRDEDEIAAMYCTKSVLNHLWYLTQELVILSIFDREITLLFRHQMVLKLLRFPHPITYGSQKPIFPTITPLLVDFPNDLIHFIGPRSWLLFDLFKLTDEKVDWMKAPAHCWNDMAGYRNAEKIVRSLEVVNDCAERAIKLVSEFKDSCVNINDQNFLFQVVEEYRNRFNKRRSDWGFVNIIKMWDMYLSIFLLEFFFWHVSQIYIYHSSNRRNICVMGSRVIV
ncbi:hypothetical protein GHT06_019020 [Daphnia sinensis]|uniref:Uncharacterized protein n=1 Tax=Daphnia sinensis TaxID=1820382 RepID=A0AAD5KKR4_9CRUS|nr:hypothetical protein GHT06_019020 [Daphnia sinensis]